MFIADQDEYRRSFGEYLRRGAPIRLGRKQTAPGGQYVWRSRRDARVRPSHRANDGQLFDWSSPRPRGIRVRITAAGARPFPISMARRNSLITACRNFRPSGRTDTATWISWRITTMAAAAA